MIYSDTISTDEKEVKFTSFNLSSPAVLFEVKLTVSKGTIKWTPHSAVMFDDTLGWVPFIVSGKSFATIQRWVCETDNGSVRWIVDQENLDMLWYLNFYNQGAYEQEVHIEVSKLWES